MQISAELWELFGEMDMLCQIQKPNIRTFYSNVITEVLSEEGVRKERQTKRREKILIINNTLKTVVY